MPRTAGGAEGVLLCQGSTAGGYSLFVKDGKPHYGHNHVGRDLSEVVSDRALPTGTHDLRFEFEPTSPPDLPKGQETARRRQCSIDGKLVGNVDAQTTPFMLNPGALTCGADPGCPDTPQCTSPFTFTFTSTDTIHKVTVDVSGELTSDPAADLRAHMARQ